MASLLRSYRVAVRCHTQVRPLHVSATVRVPRQSPKAVDAEEAEAGEIRGARRTRRSETEDIVTIEDLDPAEVDDASSLGHLVLQQQRQMLYYMRLIEHEMPQLAAYRKPFVPPPPSNPVVIRSVSFGGEEHPLTRKRTIVVPVARLPLKDNAARHKFKLLAGPRWSPEPPKDSGIGVSEDNGQHGYIKISCEDFAQPAMNLKWASDALDRLVTESNTGKDKLTDLPLDTRHLEAKARKERKGAFIRGPRGARPTIKDFPKEWLPAVQPQPATFS